MKPVLQQAIIAALENIGPMTMAELILHLERSKSTLRGSLYSMRHKRIVHIERYQPQEVGGGRCSPVYALGNKPDAVETAVPHLQRNKKYRANNRAAIGIRRLQRSGQSSPASFWKGLL